MFTFFIFWAIVGAYFFHWLMDNGHLENINNLGAWVVAVITGPMMWILFLSFFIIDLFDK